MSYRDHAKRIASRVAFSRRAMNLISQIQALLPLAIEWAEAESRRVAASGTPLSAECHALATSVGVSRADLVRVELVERIPQPSHPLLQAAIQELGMLGPDTRGLTLGHAIFIQRDEQSLRLLSHELRHVYQYEQAGSIAAFLPVYLSQILEFGYAAAPLEIDARTHEHKLIS
jgi:hypothetical protein